MIKRIIIVAILVAIAAIVGVVRSNSGANLTTLISHQSAGETREEIRKTFELAPGARVEISSINGSVNIETTDSKTAEVYVQRTGASAEALARRKVVVEGNANGLSIRGEKVDSGFFSRFFGANVWEKVTVKLPRQIDLLTKGVNGSVVVGDLDGPVEVRGVNGRVQIAGTIGTAAFKGVNGNIVVGLKRLNPEGVTISGINGNIELRLNQDLNAYLEAKGMNGSVVSEIPGVSVEKEKRGRYWAQIGSGGNAINARGINGNIRLTRSSAPSTATTESEAK
jgi:DUF4097 and DUF4098 domain-containing protein YvlB